MTRRRELFEIKRWIRRYDCKTGKFVINISYETAAPKPSERVMAVAEGFGTGLDEWEKFVVYDDVKLRIGPTDIVYINDEYLGNKQKIKKP